MKPKNKYTIDELYNSGFIMCGYDGHNHYTFHNREEGIGYYTKKVSRFFYLGKTYSFQPCGSIEEKVK